MPDTVCVFVWIIECQPLAQTPHAILNAQVIPIDSYFKQERILVRLHVDEGQVLLKLVKKLEFEIKSEHIGCVFKVLLHAGIERVGAVEAHTCQVLAKDARVARLADTLNLLLAGVSVQTGNASRIVQTHVFLLPARVQLECTILASVGDVSVPASLEETLIQLATVTFVAHLALHRPTRVIGRQIAAFGRLSTRRIQFAFVNVLLTSGAGEARMTEAFELVDQIEALAIGAARIQATLVHFGLAIKTCVARNAFAPITRGFVVSKIIIERHVKHVRFGVVARLIGCGSGGVFQGTRCAPHNLDRTAAAVEQLNPAYETVLVRVLPAFAMNTRAAAAFVNVSLAQLALVARKAVTFERVDAINATGIVLTSHMLTIVYICLAILSHETCV